MHADKLPVPEQHPGTRGARALPGVDPRQNRRSGSSRADSKDGGVRGEGKGRWVTMLWFP